MGVAVLAVAFLGKRFVRSGALKTTTLSQLCVRGRAYQGSTFLTSMFVEPDHGWNIRFIMQPLVPSSISPPIACVAPDRWTLAHPGSFSLRRCHLVADPFSVSRSNCANDRSTLRVSRPSIRSGRISDIFEKVLQRRPAPWIRPERPIGTVWRGISALPPGSLWQDHPSRQRLGPTIILSGSFACPRAPRRKWRNSRSD